MTHETLTVFFGVEAEAERAITQLRAAGIAERDISLMPCAEEVISRDQEAGGPDSSASFDGLRGDDDAAAPAVRMEVAIDHARVDRDAIVAMLNAAGGAVD